MRFIRPTNRFLLVAGVAAAALGLTGWASFRAGADLAHRARPLRVAAYGEYRAPVVTYQSTEMEDGFVLLAGDSHAELAVPGPNGCGRPYLNAGLSGTRADGYADFLDHVRLAHRPAVAVVTLGTNHLLRKDNPAGAPAADRYEADLGRVVEALGRVSGQVLVAAVPPVPAASDRFIDVAGVANLTARQAAVCARLGCRTVDPYAAYRGASFGVAREGASRDGLHLADYRPAYRAIDADLCR